MAVTRIGEYKNLMDVFRRTVAVEGWASLYRGFVPTILGVIPYAGTSFFTYEQLKAFWINRARRSGDLEASQPTTLQKFCSGALAGLLGQTASYPLDIVRRRMQTATQMGVSHNKYASVLGTLTFVLRYVLYSTAIYRETPSLDCKLKCMNSLGMFPCVLPSKLEFSDQ